jgi:hypothetical protein
MSDDSTKHLKSVATQIARIEDQHLPALFRRADQASLSAQRKHFCFQKLHLGLLVLGSVTAALIPVVPVPYLEWLYGGSAVFLAVGVIFSMISSSRKYDKTWFNCRAVAESAKTVAWRFMMRVVPFEDDSTATENLILKIREIRDSREYKADALASYMDADDSSICSEAMSNARTADVGNRKNLYLASRVLDQNVWYSKKAAFNNKLKKRWFWAATISQIIAVALAIVQAVASGFPVNGVPFLTTFAAAVVAWSQMKRHGELAHSYTVAAAGLGDQKAMAADIKEESSFVNFVVQVEEILSREHAMWCARRGVLPNLNNTRR